MTGPMPTKSGDVVIQQAPGGRSVFNIWLVLDDEQQESSGLVQGTVLFDRAKAEHHASATTEETGGRIFLLNEGTAEWRLLPQ